MSKEFDNAYDGRAYTWSLVSYAPYSNLLDLFDAAKHWAYCYHDKEESEPHYHIIATFNQQVSLNTIRETISSEQNTLGECRRKCGNKWISLNVKALYGYLIHLNLPDKYQYDVKNRIVDDMQYWLRYDELAEVKKSEDNEILLQDILRQDMSHSDWELYMIKTYGKEFIRHRRHYNEFRFDHSLDCFDTSTEDETTIKTIIATKYYDAIKIIWDLKIDETLFKKHCEDFAKRITYYRDLKGN